MRISNVLTEEIALHKHITGCLKGTHTHINSYTSKTDRHTYTQTHTQTHTNAITLKQVCNYNIYNF